MTREEVAAAQIANAERTIDKCREALKHCRSYFEAQADMNATSHLSARTLYPPIHGEISTALSGIDYYLEAYGK